MAKINSSLWTGQHPSDSEKQGGNFRRIAAVAGVIAAIAFAGFLTVLAFPPFEWSQPASDVMDAASKSNEAIDAALERDRDMSAAVRKLVTGDMQACNPGSRKSEEALRYCLTRTVDLTERENASLDKVLVASQAKLRTANRLLDKSSTASQDRWFAFFDQFKRLLKWLGPAIVGAILAAMLLIAAWLQPAIRSRFRVNATFSIFGAQVNIRDILSFHEEVGNRFMALDKDISLVYRVELAELDFDRIFANVKRRIDEAFKPGRDLNKIMHRATLFVPGFVGDELVQATNYFGYGITPTAGKIGRRFSARYGIIGRSWRLRHTLYNPHVTNEKFELVRFWGFTRVEAQEVHGDEAALIAFAVKADKDVDPLGIIYIEGYEAEAFGKPGAGELDENGLEPGDRQMEALWNGLSEKPEVKALVEALLELRGRLAWDSKVPQKAVD
jgi:hypothetical protein